MMDQMDISWVVSLLIKRLWYFYLSNLFMCWNIFGQVGQLGENIF